MKPIPLRIAITQATSPLGYALAVHLAHGDFAGLDQPLHLQLLDSPSAQAALDEMVRELEDCALPLLHGVSAGDDPEFAFGLADYALLIAGPKHGGGDDHATTFAGYGATLNDVADPDVKVLALGERADASALAAMAHAPAIPTANFAALLALPRCEAASLGQATVDRLADSIAARIACHDTCYLRVQGEGLHRWRDAWPHQHRVDVQATLAHLRDWAAGTSHQAAQADGSHCILPGNTLRAPVARAAQPIDYGAY